MPGRYQWCTHGRHLQQELSTYCLVNRTRLADMEAPDSASFAVAQPTSLDTAVRDHRVMTVINKNKRRSSFGGSGSLPALSLHLYLICQRERSARLKNVPRYSRAVDHCKPTKANTTLMPRCRESSSATVASLAVGQQKAPSTSARVISKRDLCTDNV